MCKLCANVCFIMCHFCKAIGIDFSNLGIFVTQNHFLLSFNTHTPGHSIFGSCSW